MATPVTFFQSLKDGMNDGVNPALLPVSSCARLTNAQILDQLATTRPGIRVLPFKGREILKDLAIQGAIFYNPAKGMSQQSFTADLSRIVMSAGGRKFEIRVRGSSAGSAVAEVTDVTGPGLEMNPDLHLCWLYQAETYAIAQDGENCWIWETNVARFTDGYSTNDKESSMLLKDATVGVYSHGRICQVKDGRQVYIGDLIHKSNQTSPVNILGTTEQTYWATGSFFSPPSNLGGIMAAGILPRKNTQHGHAETMFHSPDGIFSIDLNIYPRSVWESQQLTNHAILGSGACGPYCLAIDDGDQIYRTKFGIQTLRSSAAQPQNLGNPMRPISWQIHGWMEADHQPYLRFCSLDKWSLGSRILCSTGMQVHGPRWFSRGIVSQNLNPVGQSEAPAAWEGLWSFPATLPHPVLIMAGDISDKDRCFILFYDDEKQIQIAEMDSSLDRDIDQCGTTHEISTQVITGEMASGDVFSTKEHTLGSLIFRKLRRTVDFGVWLRAGHDDEWVLWKSGIIQAQRQESDKPGDILRRTRDCEHRVGLGDVPQELKTARKLQALIRWRGFAQLEGLKITAGLADSDQGKPSGQEVEFVDAKFDGRDYSDFEYTEGSPWATIP